MFILPKKEYILRLNKHLHNFGQFIKCSLGFHDYRTQRLNIGLFIDSNSNISQVVTTGEECRYCGDIALTNEKLLSSQDKNKDFITILK